MSYSPEPEFEMVVKPGFLVTLASLVNVYTMSYAFVGRAPGQPLHLPEALNWAAGVVVLILLGTAVHEFGHVTAAAVVGHRWTKVVLNGIGLGVSMKPVPYGWHRITRSLAGPLVQLAIAVPMLATLGWERADVLSGRRS